MGINWDEWEWMKMNREWMEMDGNEWRWMGINRDEWELMGINGDEWE